MAAAYGVNTRDPGLSLRRFVVLLDRLPPAGHQIGEAWSVEAHLLALVADRVAELVYVTAKAAGGKPTRPKPLRRPEPGAYRTTRSAPSSRASVDPGAPVMPAKPGAKASTWAEAALMLAGRAGVRVDRES